MTGCYVIAEDWLLVDAVLTGIDYACCDVAMAAAAKFPNGFCLIIKILLRC
jgi:hypothetical protein